MKRLTVLIGLAGMAGAAATVWTAGFGELWITVSALTIAGMAISEVALKRKVAAT